MTEQELRALVREAIVRHAGGAGMTPSPAPPVAYGQAARRHASHALFVLPSGADAEGPCIIEPSVPCSHCGYCKSYGH